MNDKAIGAGMMAAGIIAILAYVWALFFAGPLGWQIAISVLALIAVGAICGIIIWIGYTLATTPPPKPIEEIEKEIEREVSEIKSDVEETKTKSMEKP